ncbi:hypothetical protein [Parapedobacter sp. 10938]|uniref:hypothetical protein n=1 Tax=Parapedobacter flavus TaxID=3110225 RepID=UPI002DBF6A9D|nr:hypothetical protein [Parapedobacter sp. 10938]MEC3881616.1 hypothetical protein [Parapedobacter sp. 10938]
MNPKIVEEFVLALEYYMDYYGLYGVDIKKLLKATTDIVKDLKNGKNGPTITKAESISQIFGLRYYQFVDPEVSPLPKEELPAATITAIDDRNENGPPESRGSYNSLNLKHFIINALVDFKDRKEFLPSDVYEVLPEELKSKLKSPIRVTGLFSNELKKNVEKTNNSLQKGQAGRPEEYYRVISLKDNE